MTNQQESVDTRAYRYIQVQQSKMWKNHRCDICGMWASETHELIFRSSTQNNEEARRLSFQKELLALLCSRCHSLPGTHSGGMSAQLLQRNINCYGYDAVEDALSQLKAVMKGQITLIMPRREETNG